MIRGKPRAPQGATPVFPFNEGDWVVLHNGTIGCIHGAGMLVSTVEVYDKDCPHLAYILRYVSNTSISKTIPADIAKTILLLQGVEL